MAKKQIKKTAYRGFFGYVVIPLLLINAYAFWQLYKTAGHLTFAVFPDSLSKTMTQLAIILAANIVVILALVSYIKFSK